MKMLDIIEDAPTPIKWAVGDDADKGLGWAKQQQTQDDSNMVIVWAHIEDLFNHTVHGYELDPTDPTGGKNSIGDRAARAKAHWTGGGHMDPSDIFVHPNGLVDWGNGRHRAVAAFQMGHEYIPVLVEKDNMKALISSGIRINKNVD